MSQGRGLVSQGRGLVSQGRGLMSQGRGYTAMAVAVAGACGVTLPGRSSLPEREQLRVQSWQEAQAELQQGRKRHTLTLHRNQPGDQQHQHSTSIPASTPSRMYTPSRET